MILLSLNIHQTIGNSILDTNDDDLVKIFLLNNWKFSL